MFKVAWVPDANAPYNDLKAKAALQRADKEKKSITKSLQDEGLFKQVEKTINLLSTNPQHPGLNTHEYETIENPYDRTKKCLKHTCKIKRPVLTAYFGVTAPMPEN